MAKGDPQTYDTSDGYGNPEQWRNAFRTRLTDFELEKALNGKSPWQILGIEMNASQKEIKSAYRKLALQFHPDKSKGDSKEFLQIQAAYQKLNTE